MRLLPCLLFCLGVIYFSWAIDQRSSQVATPIIRHTMFGYVAGASSVRNRSSRGLYRRRGSRRFNRRRSTMSGSRRSSSYSSSSSRRSHYSSGGK